VADYEELFLLPSKCKWVLVSVLYCCYIFHYFLVSVVVGGFYLGSSFNVCHLLYWLFTIKCFTFNLFL